MNVAAVVADSGFSVALRIQYILSNHYPITLKMFQAGEGEGSVGMRLDFFAAE